MLTRFANPARFMRLSGAALPALGLATVLTLEDFAPAIEDPADDLFVAF